MRKKKSEAVDVVDLQDAMQRGQVPEPEPGNETAPDAKARRNGRLKSVDLPGMRGKGVERLEDAGLEALGDEYRLFDRLCPQHYNWPELNPDKARACGLLAPKETEAVRSARPQI